MREHPRREDDSGTTGALGDLSQLSRWISHEINNPLGGIQNAFLLIRDAVPAGHPHYKYLAAIDREIVRIAELTKRIQGTYGYENRPGRALTLSSSIADAVRALDPLRAARRVEVTIEVPGVTGSAALCSEPCQGAIRHLIQHAIEVALPDSAVPVVGWEEGGRIWVAVPARRPGNNEGRGIVAGPQGLALKLVERLVRAVDGDISMAFDDTGFGEIRIAMPVHDSQAETA